MKKGFTLIELMIVVAIIAVIAAIAIPSLLQSRMATNETMAIAALKTIGSAQNIWNKSDTDGNAIKDYSTNISALNTTVVAGAPVALIDDAIANAAEPAVQPYNGYWLQSNTPAAPANTDDWSACAFPSTYGRSGVRTFSIDTQGVVLMKDNAGAPVAAHPTGVAGWIAP